VRKIHPAGAVANRDVLYPASQVIRKKVQFKPDSLTCLILVELELDARMLEHARLAGKFHEVPCGRKVARRKLLCFEQTTPAIYSGRPSDAIPGVVKDVRQFLWVAINTDPPYRRYYVYLAPPAEHGEVLPQILSIYAVMYYLGSIVRYRRRGRARRRRPPSPVRYRRNEPRLPREVLAYL
jgi:hypothetical protein